MNNSNYLVLVFLLLFSNILLGQILLIEDFESLDCNSGPCNGHVSNNCFPGWNTSHGSPSDPFLDNGFNSDKALWMAAQGPNIFNNGTFTSEGAFTSLSVEEGDCVEFCMMVGINGADVTLLDISATSDLVHNTTGPCGELPPNSNNEMIATISTTPSSTFGITNWQRVCVTHTFTSSHSQLWFSPRATNNTANSAVLVDDLVIRIPECIDDITFSTPGQSIPPGITQTTNTITTGNPSGGAVRNLTSPISATTELRSSRITLTSKTHLTSSNSSSILLKIDPCATDCISSLTSGPVIGQSNKEFIESNILNTLNGLSETLSKGRFNKMSDNTSRAYSINEAGHQSLIIYPNPFEDKIYFNKGVKASWVENNENLNIVVLSLNGSILYRKNNIKTSDLINNGLQLNLLHNGTFIIKLSDCKGDYLTYHINKFK